MAEGTRVSILVPAWQAQAFVADAVASALAQTHRDIEVIVAPDDGEGYGWLLPGFADSRLKVLPPRARWPTGPGPTRNLAMRQATGDFLFRLDADDRMPATVIEALLPQARAHGIAAGPVEYHAGGAVGRVRRVEVSPCMGVQAMGQALATFCPLLARSHARRYARVFAEDFLHDGLVVAGRADGRLAGVSDAPAMWLSERMGSLSRQADPAAEARIRRAYRRIIRYLRAQAARVRGSAPRQAARIDALVIAFAFRHHVSGCYGRAGADSYQAWVAPRIETLWRDFLAVGKAGGDLSGTDAADGGDQSDGSVSSSSRGIARAAPVRSVERPA